MTPPDGAVAAVTATVPITETPVWAALQRRLFDVLDHAWREFESLYCSADGGLVYHGQMHGRDGVDDFYEPFFNWPVLYQLGGSDDLLAAAKHHWEGVTTQMTDVGFVRDEFELGYDWFHIGESMIFFYALCAADPDDEVFRDRAKRFASLYTDPAAGNFDLTTTMIVAPHNGSGGPRFGLGEDWAVYRADQDHMRIYGLPLHDVPGITDWGDLGSKDNAGRMGDAMQDRMGTGDTVVSLAATSLVTNAWLYDHENEFKDWVLGYVGAWRERADANGGLIPDNVGPSGTVGELHDGNWFGGHYGWTWPHGLYAVEPAVLTAVINETILTSSTGGLDLARTPLDTVSSLGVDCDRATTRGSLGAGWAEKLGLDPEDSARLVPYRVGPDGWFDFNPMPHAYPLWLWWLTLSDDDEARVAECEATGGFDWTVLRQFHDKEEQGHEAPWFAYLRGRNPDYPEQALSMALAQVSRRIALMRANPGPPEGDDIHWWQRLNPVVTEILVQLTTGALPAVYNGGLSLARVRLGDGSARRPGLPPGVAALVSSITNDVVTVELANLDTGDERTVVIQAGAFGEDRIDRVDHDAADAGFPGSPHHYSIPVPRITHRTVDDLAAPRLEVRLPASTRITLQLTITRRAFRASHTSFTATDVAADTERPD
jgi:hypothetical protein